MEKMNTIGKNKIASLFDCGTFAEIGAHLKRAGANEAYDGVICGYGSVSGKLAFAFIQDSDRTKGAFDEIGAKKITMLYDMAIKNGAPIIGVFDSAGAVVLDGSAALSAYGSFMASVAKASGIVPQIAIIDGVCTGLSLCCAAMFDMVITATEKASTYINAANKNSDKTIKVSIKCATSDAAFASARELVEILPQNNNDSACDMSGDDPARAVAVSGLSGKALVESICDNSKFIELGNGMGDELVCGLAFFGGMLCGVVASDYTCNNGKITCKGAKKATDLISFCDRFGIAILTLVNSEGFGDKVCATAPAALVSAYANASAPKITIVCGKAYGAGFTLLGSKSIGADIAYATEDSIISVMSPESAVAFLMNDSITAEKSRADVEAEWCEKYASALCAAEKGDIDDIIPEEEVRARIISALYMLSTKTDLVPTRKHFRMPL